MTPFPPSSREPSGMPTSRTPTIGGRVQRDVRLQAALALVVGIAVVAVPLFIWGRGKKKGNEAAAAPSTSASVEDLSAPTVIFGDAGASLAVDAGAGRTITFGEPCYLKCQDPGPGKTAPEKCDHLGVIEELVTKTITERLTSCLPPITTAQTVNFVVDVHFKKKKMRVKDGKDGSTMPAAQRKKFAACVEKGLVSPNWDTVGHAHMRYVFQILATFSPPPGGAGAGYPAAGVPAYPGAVGPSPIGAAPVGAPPVGAAPAPGPTVPP